MIVYASVANFVYCVYMYVWMLEEWSIPFQCLVVLNVYINGYKGFVNIFFGKVSLCTLAKQVIHLLMFMYLYVSWMYMFTCTFVLST